MLHYALVFLVIAVIAAGLSGGARGEEFTIHGFERRELTDVYYIQSQVNQETKAVTSVLVAARRAPFPVEVLVVDRAEMPTEN